MNRTAMFSYLLFAAIAVTGCTVNPGGGGGPDPEILLNVTNRTIADGQEALAFTFEAAADDRVTISVQAGTDLADPNFIVVFGVVDFEDLDDVPLGDVVLQSADEGSGEEIDSFEGVAAGDFSLFVTDANDWPGATFSITVTQQ